MNRIDARELCEWEILEELEPYGERGEYTRAWLVAASTVAAWGGTVDPVNFFPRVDESEAETPEEAAERHAEEQRQLKEKTLIALSAIGARQRAGV